MWRWEVEGGYRLEVSRDVRGGWRVAMWGELGPIIPTWYFTGSPIAVFRLPDGRTLYVQLTGLSEPRPRAVLCEWRNCVELAAVALP